MGANAYEQATRSINAIAYMQLLGLNDLEIHNAVINYPTWADLAGASPSQRSAALGHRAGNLNYPADLPEMRTAESGTTTLCRYLLGYPRGLSDMPVPPALLRVKGTLPSRMLAILTGPYPSAAATAVALSGMRAAGESGAAVVVPLHSEIGYKVLTEAMELGVRVVAVTPQGINRPGQHQRLIEEILVCEGAVVSFTHPDAGTDSFTDLYSWRVCAGLASAVLAAEVGVRESDGLDGVRAAIGMGRPLIVPILPGGSAPGVPPVPASEGNALLTRPGADLEAVFGDGRAAQRSAALLPGADYCPTSLAEAEADVKAALGEGEQTGRPDWEDPAWDEEEFSNGARYPWEAEDETPTLVEDEAAGEEWVLGEDLEGDEPGEEE